MSRHGRVKRLARNQNVGYLVVTYLFSTGNMIYPFSSSVNFTQDLGSTKGVNVAVTDNMS